MNETVNKFFLARDRFMLEMHLRQPGITSSACGPFSKNKEKIQKFKETRDLRQIYKNNLDKADFQQDMAHGDFKDLLRRTIWYKVLRDKLFNFAKKTKYDRYQLMVYKFFDKKSAGKGVATFANKSEYVKYVKPRIS